MLRKLSARRIARLTPIFAGGLAAFAVSAASPATAAADRPTDGGRISYTMFLGTASIWPDGTHNELEFFNDSAPYARLGSWHADGTKLVVTSSDRKSVHVFEDGNPNPTTLAALNDENFVSAAIGPDGSRVATASDQSVTIRNGGLSTELFGSPAGRIAWSGEGTDGTLVWESDGESESPQIPAGRATRSGDVAAGIWASIQGGQPQLLVEDKDASNPSISQDGRIVAYNAPGELGTGIDVFYLDLTEQSPQPKRLAASTLNDDGIPAVSPDGTQVAFGPGDTSTLSVADVAGGPARLVAFGSNTYLGLAWQPVHKATAGTVTVSGTAQVGETLTTGGVAATGTAPVTTAYQWQRCTLGLARSGDGCVDIAGATASSYTLTEDDKGYQVRVKRTATNSGGPAVATSAMTTTVADAPPPPPDTVKPEQPVFSDGPDSTTLETTATFEWTGAEQGGKFQCQIVGAVAGSNDTTTPWADCTSPFSTPALEPGAHSFRVRQVDDSSNEGDYRQYDWTVQAPPDTTDPEKPVFTTEPNPRDSDTTPTFEWTGAEPGGRFECKLDAGLARDNTGSSWVPCASPYTVPNTLTEGYYTFAVRQFDAAENPGKIEYVSWFLDTTAPDEVILLETPMLTTPFTTATFKFADAEKGDTLECRVDAQPEREVAQTDTSKWHECASPYVIENLAPGKHKFELRKLDDAGNASPVAVWNWIVKAPAVVEEPKPVTPAPVVETPAPAVQTPAPVVETPKPTAPRAVTAPKAPALTATIGGTKSGAQVGANGGTSSAAVIEVAKESVGVGCSITGTVLKSCKVDLYAPRASGATARAAASNLVLVGTGTYEAKNGSESMDVKIELNSIGKKMLRANPAGLRVQVKILGKPVSGAPLKATGVAKLVTDRASLTVGGFAVRSSVLTAKAKRELRTLAKFGKAHRVTCVGHTDGSSQDDDYLKSLGARRAKAVCAYLAKHGLKPAGRKLVSKADTKPAATNATKAGRAKNRRVQVTIVR